MTRQKKTRSAGPNGQRYLSADDARKTREPKEQTKKKGAGLKSGNRHSPTVQKTDAGAASAKAKDKRIGSKVPVPLVPLNEQPADAVIAQPKASLSKVRPVALTAEQELMQIENDSYLQQLLERVENDEILTGKDAKYFNAKTARLEQLLQQLGLDDSNSEDDTTSPADPMAEFEKRDWRKDLLGDED